MRKYLKEGQYSFEEANALGKGSFGKVFKGYDHSNSLWVAIKSINLELLEVYGIQMKTIILNEISVMKKFTKKMQEKQCPYLVKHYDCFRTDTNIYIVMELCQRGTLQDYIDKYTLNEEQVKTILKQIISGLIYLDELSICHRDLKPENIFIAEEFKDGKEQIYYKIGDFGFAAQKQTYKQVLGTYPFMAPQIYKREQYTSKVDVWSLGIIAYQLLFKELYFFGKNKWEIEKKVKENEFFMPQNKKGTISAEMKEFIGMCLTKDKQKRPVAADLLKCSLFQQQNLSIFQAIEHELFFCQLLRTMAEEICDFGLGMNRNTEFIEMYLLKNAFADLNYLTYSLTAKVNYLNISTPMFDTLIKEKHRSKFNELLQKVQKQNILTTEGFQSKFQYFCNYISKFSPEQQEAIKNVIRAEQVYSQINRNVFRAELKKWILTLSSIKEYEDLLLKCQKLMEL